MDTKEKIAVAGILTGIVTGWKSEWMPAIVHFWDALTLWRFGFIISLGYLLWWWVDRRTLKRSQWLSEAKGAIDSYGVRLDTVIATHEAKLAASRTDWARQLRELIEDAVQYKANLATVQAEAKARIQADAEINRKLDELISRLPPVVGG
jgi:hypothetical protein